MDPHYMSINQLFFKPIKNQKYKGKKLELLDSAANIEAFKKELSNLLIINNLVDVSKIDFNKYYSIYLILFQNRYSIENLNKKCKILGFYGFNTKATTLQFYLDRGFTLEESKTLLKKRQSKGIKHYLDKGFTEEDAKVKVSEAANKGQKTLQSSKNYECVKRSRGNHSKIEHYLTQINPNTNIFYTLEEIHKMFKDTHVARNKTRKHRLAVGITQKPLSFLCIEYHIKRGKTEQEARAFITSRQTTFSLDICINKYGKQEGLKVWRERQDKWLATLDGKSDEEKREILIKKTQRSNFYSASSIKCFNKIIDYFCLDIDDIFMGDNEYFIYDNELKRIFYYDFTIKSKKLIIEYNGSHVHPPYGSLKFNEETWIQPFTKENAKQVKERDDIKIKTAKDKGFKVIQIWDYQKENEILQILGEYL